jgi:CRP-like cAMP-binding protein
MNEDQHGVGALRERLANGAEDRLGRALGDLLENPVISGAIGRAFDAREKAAQAQELAMGALNLPSAADIERLTRRLRSLSQRLEGIEDGLSRIDRGTGQRLSAIEDQLGSIAAKVQDLSAKPAAPRRTRSTSTSRGKAAAKPASSTGSPRASRAKSKS